MNHAAPRPDVHTDAESLRLAQDARREHNWKRWGPYLAERQWATVREDYSDNGDCWNHFPHDHARSRAYRWGEDGLLGFTDRQCRLCFALALWNGKDPILKERLFGLTGPEGNHGEDVKEHYFYLDSTPTHSYAKALYKYPHAEFPYAQLVHENRARGRDQREFELADTGVFDDGKYFDITIEYAKASPDDILIEITAANRGMHDAPLVILPTLWFRNTWAWGCTHEGCERKPELHAAGPTTIHAEHASLGAYRLDVQTTEARKAPELLFTENETNLKRLYNTANTTPYVKDAFHHAIVNNEPGATNPEQRGTKACAVYRVEVPAGDEVTIRLRLRRADLPLPANGKHTPSESLLGAEFDAVIATRRREADEFYNARGLAGLDPQSKNVARQAYAGLLWSKQFYHYVVESWLRGDPAQPPPPPGHANTRNSDWPHLYCRDVLSMPDKWEYPWFAAWDLAFHMIPMARIDPDFAKHQLLLMLREWYMHPSGQIPAYEFAFSDVNPPVHAWACWRVYKMSAPRGKRDTDFLARAFQKLLLNFTWWVNRKDPTGKHLFSGGFLGLDNIGVFDRSRPLPTGGHLEQADGTAWMAFYCGTMLSMALELARHDPAYEDLASKFFEHFVHITDAMNTLGGAGLWDENDRFYYDQIRLADHHTTQPIPLRVRSLVGVIPILAVEVLEEDTIDRLPGFKKRMDWFLQHRPELARHITRMTGDDRDHRHVMLAIPSRDRLQGVLQYLLDEAEFLSPFGVRSVSRRHLEQPYVFHTEGIEHRVDYCPGESTTALFGGNSNWRGPIWFPINFLIVEALERFHHFYGDSLRVECPARSGVHVGLDHAAHEIRRRLAALFLPDADGVRPAHRGDSLLERCPHSRELVLYHEHFHGDTGRGLGATHQTGWTALIATVLTDLAKHYEAAHVEPKLAVPRGFPGAASRPR